MRYHLVLPAPRPASATSRSVTAHAAAVTAMLVPFAFPLLRTAQPGGIQQWAGDVLVAAGTAWAVWSLRSLGRSVAVLAQARVLVDRGPYRWVRHPLYTGEIVSSLGLALLAGSLAALAVWLGSVSCRPTARCGRSSCSCGPCLPTGVTGPHRGAAPWAVLKHYMPDHRGHPPGAGMSCRCRAGR